MQSGIALFTSSSPEPTYTSADPTAWGAVTLGLLEALPTATAAGHVDIVWWTAEGATAAPLLTTLLTDAAAAMLRPAEPFDTWPFLPEWHPIETSGGCRFTCTTQSLAHTRIWYLGADAPWQNPPAGTHSVSSLVSTDDLTGYDGALRDYINKLAANHQHLAASAFNDHDIDTIRHDRIGSRLVNVQRRAQAALETSTLNADRSRDTLCRRLHDLGGGPGPSRDWAFATDDARDQREAIATVAFNATRAATMLDEWLAESTSKATRSNTFATLMLAVVAGSLGAGQLAEHRQHRTGVGMLVGGLLLAIGVLITDATVRYQPAHRLIVAIATGLAASGAAIRFAHPAWLCILLGLAGAVTGYVTCHLLDSFTFSPRLARLRGWLTGDR